MEIPILSESNKEAIIKAIKQAELNTSGEIKVHIESKCVSVNAYDRAKVVFDYLSLHKTALRNGVLIYWAYEDQKIAILGDKGINNKVSSDYWNSTLNLISSNFKSQKYQEGLCEAILEIGEKLKLFFPYQGNDRNEISDDISTGK